ncbi:putative reverse transcriptase domain-containing protein [Tanacetum coccineum]
MAFGEPMIEEVSEEAFQGHCTRIRRTPATASCPTVHPDYIQVQKIHRHTTFSSGEDEREPIFGPHGIQITSIDSPTAESPGYVTESDPEEDPRRGYEGMDDANDEDEDEEDEEDEEEEEHLAPADSTTITVRPQTSISFPPEAEVERLLLTWTTPSHRHYLNINPLQGSALASPSGLNILIGSIDAVTTALPPPPLPPLPLSLYIPSHVDRRDDIPESEQTYQRILGLDPARGSSRGDSTKTLGRGHLGSLELAELLMMPLQETVDGWWRRRAHRTQLTAAEYLSFRAQHRYTETRFQMQHAELAALRETDCRRQDQMVETLRVIRDMRREMSDMQTEVVGMREPPRRLDSQDQRLGFPAMIDQALLQNSTNGDGSHGSHEDNRRNVHTARPCFYADFMKCQPLNFKGTEGVVGLTRWIEKMESVFNISGCAIKNQVKFATCTLLGAALTLWNGQIRTLVKGNDVPAYTERFQELTLICTKFVANETEKVDKYISGLPDNIYRNVKSARPKTLDETIELANDLMDQKLRTYAERQSDNKRKADDLFRNNHGEKKPYGGSLPKCTKCHLHHNGPCTQKCHKCNKVGHFARDCRSTGNTNVANTQKGNGAAPKGNGCFECGAPGHFKRDYPKLKNKDGGMGMHKAGFMQLGM